MDNNTNNYPVVGRHPDVDLSRYSTNVHGREVIDYEKLKRDDPSLYQETVNHELEFNRLDSKAMEIDEAEHRHSA